MSRTFNMVRGSGPKATLAVTVTNGTATSVTATKSGVSVSLTYGGGVWTAVLPSFGTWTVSATDGTHSQTDTVNASVAGLYTLTLRLQDIPNDYTQLEYIESSGSVIKTGYYPVSTCNISTKIMSPATISQWASYWFASDNNSPRRLYGWEYYDTNGNGYYYNSMYNGSNIPYVHFRIPSNTVVTMTTSGRNITANGTTYSIASNGYIAITTNTTAELGIAYIGRTYYFTITGPNGDALVRNYVPAKRNSDGVVGMYDKANDIFYGSANDNAFIAGPEVN